MTMIERSMMINALISWLFCVLGAVGVVAWGVRIAGRDLAWVGRHLFGLILLCGALAYLTAWAGTKPGPGPGPGPEPPEPPTPSGVTNWTHRIPVGRRADGTIMPYGAPIRSVK